MAKYNLKEVITSRDAKEWLHLDRRIYRDALMWVCPLDDDIEKVFDSKRNHLFADGEAVRWIAYDDKGEAVGRIAAFYNREQTRVTDNMGCCGFFESIDNQEVANLLFDAAREWLTERGLEGMDGPVNFGSRDSWWGLLVEGFDYQPLYGNPYHLPYYKALFENYGFQNYFNQNSYVWRAESGVLSEIALEKAHRVLANPDYQIKDVRNTDLSVAAEQLRTIYNKAWSLFTGVKEMTEAEAQKLMRTLRPIIDRELIYFAYHNYEPIGFFVMVPDLNRIIGKFDGKFGLWQKLQLVWELKVRKSCDRAFGIIFGITPEFQGKGIESAIMTYILENYVQTGRSHYRSFEFAWIGDFNPVMNRMIERYVCASKHKMHTTYRYLFDRTREFHRCPRLGIRRTEN
jgi:GNAT superfamily N-acetyltransferase